MNLIYFTKIVKQVPQLILISLVGTDRSARRSLIWEEAGGLGENPAGDHYTLPQTSIAYHGDHTYVTALKCECTVHYATWTPKPSTVFFMLSGYYHIISNKMVFIDLVKYVSSPLDFYQKKM